MQINNLSFGKIVFPVKRENKADKDDLTTKERMLDKVLPKHINNIKKMEVSEGSSLTGQIYHIETKKTKEEDALIKDLERIGILKSNISKR